MSILETILNSGNGALVGQVANSLKLDKGKAGAAIAELLPALKGGIRRNVEQPEGLGALMSALQRGHHADYVEKPDLLSRAATITDGNAILGHLLGSKDESRKVAAEAASRTGVDVGTLKKMLPMVAAMAMGSLSKESKGSGALSSLIAGGASSAGAGLLSSFLDRDEGGSAVDGLLGMARKFF
ncbi:MAG: DUF937 domain-containing protein [Pseudomonadota bacterium]